MTLENITCPADLRELGNTELDELCDEIRQFIVDKVNQSNAGGHLGSNLGIVELTVAMHRALDSPRDIILFDTGHQAYVHKILTGRQAGFDSLREAGAMSGYPSQQESPHDWIENSHASTVLGYAHGLAEAFARAQEAGAEERRIVAVLGDGSMTGGMAYEGLNNLGVSNADVTIVLNDNGRSYAPTVSLLSESLVKIRSNPVYMERQRWLEKTAASLPVIGKYSNIGIQASKAAIREALEPQAFFEQLGVRYMGPFDGHDIAEVEKALENAGEFKGPVVLHVQTQKGRGYGPAENDPIKNMHDVGAVKPDTCAAAFAESLIKLAEEHPDLLAITAAMPDSTGLLPFHERYPDKVIDVGIAEQHAVTAAAGMAMGGLRPVVALYSTFLTRAIDQANLDVGLHGQPVIFCLDRAGITGHDGPSHHGILDMVLMSKVPGMTILCPSSYQEVQQMLADAYDITTGPICIRWPKVLPQVTSAELVGRGLSARMDREGTDVCIIGVGKMFAAAQEAADLLAARNISASVWDPRAAKPLDPKMLDHAAGHRLVVTIEDGLAEGGIGSNIAASLFDRGRTDGPKSRVKILGVPTEYLPHGKPDAILADLGLDGAGVAKTITEILAD